MSSFKTAFAAARKAGKKTFTWNGKPYTTKLAEEVSSAPKVSKKPSARPAPKPATKPIEAGSRPQPTVAGKGYKAPPEASAIAPKTSSKPVANPRNAPGFLEKLRMGSSARTQANLTEAEMLKRRRQAAARAAGKG